MADQWSLSFCSVQKHIESSVSLMVCKVWESVHPQNYMGCLQRWHQKGQRILKHRRFIWHFGRRWIEHVNSKDLNKFVVGKYQQKIWWKNRIKQVLLYWSLFETEKCEEVKLPRKSFVKTNIWVKFAKEGEAWRDLWGESHFPHIILIDDFAEKAQWKVFRPGKGLQLLAQGLLAGGIRSIYFCGGLKLLLPLRTINKHCSLLSFHTFYKCLIK